ncbi:MAG: hypothetical protein KAT43_05520 [Nanoarchaeota archaeon]|nr:hypothetical protein [Nanoarchaeota archaeon]
MTNPTEKTDYVTYSKFGAEVSRRLGHPRNRFPKDRVRRILWWADEAGRDGFDKEMTESGPLIALSGENLEKFLGLLPDWKEEAERRKNADPFEHPFPIGPQLEERAQPPSRHYVKNYYRKFMRR